MLAASSHHQYILCGGTYDDLLHNLTLDHCQAAKPQIPWNNSFLYVLHTAVTFTPKNTDTKSYSVITAALKKVY